MCGGGSSPSGFDCSGFTQYVMRACGYSIYRTATDQLENGYAVSYSDLQPGDLVFFERTYNTDAPASHVGIYVGGRRVLHAGGSYVKISSLSSDYYASRYVGARPDCVRAFIINFPARPSFPGRRARFISYSTAGSDPSVRSQYPTGLAWKHP